MTILAGTRLGPYEVLSLLGAGGMGEVYRARDTRLGREVAIKVLSAAIASNTEHLRRFEQEARSASALSDPHIVAVFDVGEHEGIHYFASELVEGGDLRGRLGDDEGLPVRKALDIAEQIASGLAAAHEKGITHRDLKPENILLTRSGEAKIADFGLAKLAEAPGAELSRMPTADRVETTEGVVMGTVSYMSPEQACGRKVDYRSDQFSFGLILYEMLTGKLAFRRETKGETLAAILRDEPPPISESNPAVPAPLSWIVERCLAKDPEERYASTRDLAREISAARRHLSDATRSSGTPAVAPPPARRRTRERIAWAGFVLASLLAALLTAGYRRRAPRPAPMIRTSVAVPERVYVQQLALAPDGEKLAFTAGIPGAPAALWIRPLDGAAARALPGTEGASCPFWSPDSRSVGFFGGGKLKKVDAAGGPVLPICEAERGYGGAWNRDGTIVFAEGAATALSRVPASGGQPSPVTKLDRSRQETSHRYPFFLPDGRHFLYMAVNLSGASNHPANAVRAASLDGKSDVSIVPVASNALYAAGILVYVRDGTLLLQRFDPDRLRTEGNPVPVAERLWGSDWLGYSAVSVSDRLLVYQEGTASPSQLLWYDRKGMAVGSVGEPGLFLSPRLSPDARQIAVDVFDPEKNGLDVWLYDVSTGAGRKFAFGGWNSAGPVWSPDGSRIAFSSNQKSQTSRQDVWIKALDGTKAEIFAGSDDSRMPTDWSPDGRSIALTAIPAQGKRSFQLWTASLPDGKDAVAREAGGFRTGDGRFSPDGRWLAFESDESGRDEIYVRAFPGPGGKWQVSNAGGDIPRWRGDGKELYYVSLDNRIMAVPVGIAPGFHAGPPAPLFPVHPTGGTVFDVTPDGQRFLVNSVAGNESSPPLDLIVDWMRLLEKR